METLKILGILAGLQALRFGLKSLMFLVVERTHFTDRVASMIAMLLLTGLILALAKARKIELSVFPKRFGPAYVVLTALTAALLIATPLMTRDVSGEAVTLLVYAGVVTPVFEELIFRGYVWNRLNALLKREWLTYAVSVLLFALWHFGYADALAFRVKAGLGVAMLWKAFTGLCFGVVLGALRLKAKNCYATMLLHGALNIFGR